MSKKLCAILMRLYPQGFRQRYGDEALRLILDRARDEKGVLRQFRLLLDVTWDMISIAPMYWSVPQAPQASPAPNTTISFQFVGDESPSPASLLMGFIVALTLLAALPLGFAGSGTGTRWSFPRGPLVAQLGPTEQAESQRSQVSQLDAATRHQLIEQAIANIKEHYIDTDAARKMTESLQANDSKGIYNSITDRKELASILTRELREVSHDPHVEVIYSERPLPNAPPPSPSAAMAGQNCTFEKAQILPDKIGYLKFDFFPSTFACEERVRAVLSELNEAQSVILDLRDNRGGFPDMVMLIASYFFDHPEYMYNPRENTTERSWTRSPVSGSKLAGKPLYLLTSSRTASAAEHFSYDLKMLKRATLVGETTRGTAHAGMFHRIDDHFGIALTEVRPINPFSKVDWEGVGVEPDVKVKADDALPRATALVRKHSLTDRTN